ncbi:hypothetical protein T02_8662 [Trichinella nativa]|uniref:Uncharacterized protein n=1 Tax=Trichinella nativa TaxID=6335 RepID=A0A0V1L0V4_9BILA|nr:hypothetical protein T02_8662 [Trichinella nativa]
MDNVQATVLGLSLPSSFEDGDFKRWLLHFEVCAEANGWSDTIKAKKLPTFLKGDALIIFLDCPAAVKSNYKLLIGALKSKLNPKASQVAAFDEFQRATLMTGKVCDLLRQNLSDIILTSMLFHCFHITMHDQYVRISKRQLYFSMLPCRVDRVLYVSSCALHFDQPLS